MGLALQWASGLETRGVQGDQLLWVQPCLPCTWGAQTRPQALSTLALPAATYGCCGEWSLGGWPRGHTDPGACHRMPKSATGVLKCPWPCTECSLVSVTHPEGRLWCQASAACNARESVETMGPPGSWWVQQMDQGHATRERQWELEWEGAWPAPTPIPSCPGSTGCPWPRPEMAATRLPGSGGMGGSRQGPCSRHPGPCLCVGPAQLAPAGGPAA